MMSANTEMTVVDPQENALADLVSLAPKQSNNMMAVDAHRAASEVLAAMMVADSRPRNPKDCVDNILKECRIASVAMKALYKVERGRRPDGGTNYVIGPSIRLAEVIVRNWMHTHSYIEELESTENWSTWRAVVWDAQTNSRKMMTKTIQHVRNKTETDPVTKLKTKKLIKLTNTDEIYEVCMSRMARLLRNCILAMVPIYVVESAVAECGRTNRVSAQSITLERVMHMLEKFAECGVTKAMIENYIGKKIDKNSLPEPAQFVELGNIFNSISDRMATAEDFFEVPEERPTDGEGQTPTDKMKKTSSRAKEAVRKSREEAAAEPDASNEESEKASAETLPASNPIPHDQELLLAQLTEKIGGAFSATAIDAVHDEGTKLRREGKLNDAAWDEFVTQWNARNARIARK